MIITQTKDQLQNGHTSNEPLINESSPNHSCNEPLMHELSTKDSYSHLFVGMETLCPLSDGTKKRYIYLDNGASTPCFKSVHNLINAYVPYYSSVHRGAGFKSQISTSLYERSRSETLSFVNANPKDHVCIFTRNTTESINLLSQRFPFMNEKKIVISTGMEHHANDLSWRAYAPKTVYFINQYDEIHCSVLLDGRLDLNDLKDKLKEYNGKIGLVAVTGASNVTGVINPIHEIARMAHEVGAQIFVDCAQLIAHRSVDMKDLNDPEHLDYIAFSGHKMYAPFGQGVLIGRQETFNQGEPVIRGGGAVKFVTIDSVIWAQAPDRDEAGSPNIVGAISLLAAIKTLKSIGMSVVSDHETQLTSFALEKMSLVPGIRIYGDRDPNTAHTRVGVISFTLSGFYHGLVAAILSHEFGIGVRNGCFCAHPLVTRLLEIPDAMILDFSKRIAESSGFSGCGIAEKPGTLRASFGLENTIEDVEALVSALHLIVERKNEYDCKYEGNQGEYYPIGYKSRFDEYVDVDCIVNDTIN